MTNKDLQKFLKQFPKDAEIRIHYYKPDMERDCSASMSWDQLRVNVLGEILQSGQFFYRLGGKKFYKQGEYEIWRDDVDIIFIG